MRKGFKEERHSGARDLVDIRQRFMAVVLFSAFIVGIESVFVETMINSAGVGSYAVAAVPSMIGGIILLAYAPRSARVLAVSLHGRGWLYMLGASVFIAAGVLLWFDAVGRIGASKEAILGGGSFEVLFIVLLSVLFLSERMTKWEIAGSALILGGVFLVLANTDTMSISLGLGEAEAIISSFLLAISVVMSTILLRSHSLTPISGLELVLSGVILTVFGVGTGAIEWFGLWNLFFLIVLGCLPAIGMLTYNAGLFRIGASLTSVLFALTGIITVGIQLVVLAVVPGSEMILPQSVPLAVLGGFIAFAGVYLLNVDGRPEDDVSSGTNPSMAIDDSVGPPKSGKA